MSESEAEKYKFIAQLANKTSKALLDDLQKASRRIAELEADLENIEQQRNQDVLDCQKIVASKHEIMDSQKQRIAELEAAFKREVQANKRLQQKVSVARTALSNLVEIGVITGPYADETEDVLIVLDRPIHTKVNAN